MKDMALEMSSRPSPVSSRTESPTMMEIIDKFHRLKDERFKQRENVYIKQNAGGEYKLHSEPGQFRRAFERPLSGNQKMRSLVKDNIQPKRRLSLPNIFRMETPPPIEEPDAGEISARKIKEQQQSRAIARRYSTSHVMHEYSKRDIKQLFKAGRRSSVDEVRPLVAKPTDNDEENMKRWLTGEDLHFFYNMWDKRQKPKIRSPRRLPPIHSCVNNITQEDIGRPRLNTL